MQPKFKKMLYGGDYNPNQWPKEIWDEDMKLFHQAGINSTTINVFSWAKIQPSENEYDFTELDEIVDTLTKEDVQIVMATSTGALPAWMVHRYPEVARTDFEGRHHKFGHRHNACPNSPVFQKYAKRLAEKLAERYGDNKNIVCWHISNEYGGECYCENCAKAFRVWLKDKYKTLDEVNKAWNMEFWGHTIYGWDEIVPPNDLGDGMPWGSGTAFAGMSLDYMRFNSDGMLNNYKMERDAIRKYDKETPITTNLMGTYKGLDYFKWAKEMDIVSWGQLPELQYTMEPRSYDPRPDARPQRRTVYADGADSEPAELAAVQLLKETWPDARTELSDRCTRRRHDSVLPAEKKRRRMREIPWCCYRTRRNRRYPCLP